MRPAAVSLCELVVPTWAALFFIRSPLWDQKLHTDERWSILHFRLLLCKTHSKVQAHKTRPELRSAKWPLSPAKCGPLARPSLPELAGVCWSAPKGLRRSWLRGRRLALLALRLGYRGCQTFDGSSCLVFLLASLASLEARPVEWGKSWRESCQKLAKSWPKVGENLAKSWRKFGANLGKSGQIWPVTQTLSVCE